MLLRWGFSERAGLQQRALALEKQPEERREKRQKGMLKKRLGDFLAGVQKHHHLLQQGC